MRYEKENEMREKEERYNSNGSIKCNVTKCVHNCLEDSTCRLEEIKVCECLNDKRSKKKEDQTSCGSYEYCGGLNEEEYR